MVLSWVFFCQCVTSSSSLLADLSNHGLDEFIFSMEFFSIHQYGSFLISMVHHELFGYHCIVGIFVQVTSFRWIHLFNEFTYVTAFWCCPDFQDLNEFIVFLDCFDKSPSLMGWAAFYCLDEFIVFMNCLDEFTS